MSCRIYIAGPMRGRPEHNFPAFHEAEARFRAMDFDVVSPVTIGETLFGNNPDVPGGEYIRADLRALIECDCIALLPEWETSTGARCEVVVALTIGHGFYDATTGKSMLAPSRVVCNGGYERPAGRVLLLDDVLDDVRVWQRETFPHATRASVAAHLLKEAKELNANPDDDEEVADVGLLLAGMMDNAGLARAMVAKLAKNRTREWGQPDADGVVEHIERALPTPANAFEIDTGVRA